MGIKKGLKSIVVLLLGVSLLVSCGDNKDIENLGGNVESEAKESSSSSESAGNSSPDNETSNVEENTDIYDIYTPRVPKEGLQYLPEKFQKEGYILRLSNERKKIYEVKELYADQNALLKENGINNMNFENCTFCLLPDFENVRTYYLHDPYCTPEESWNLVEYWAKKMDPEGKLDLDKEVVNTSRVAKEGEATGEYWPLAKNTYDEKSGKWDEKGGQSFALINHKVGYIDVQGSGVKILSFGKIAAYYEIQTGEEAWRDTDPYKLLGAELIKKGKYEELKDEKYELFDGVMSVEEGAKIVRDYFNFSDDKVELDYYQVEIYKEFDKNVYYYCLRRKYNGIPITWANTGTVNYYGDTSKYFPHGEVANGVVCDSEGIDAYYGFKEKEKFEGIIPEQDTILDLSSAAKRVEEVISNEYKCEIKSVEFCYADNELVDTYGRVLLPSWEFYGENLVDNNYIHIYVDALTGDVTFYECSNGI